MARSEIDALWQSAFPDAVRPVAFTTQDLDDEEFAPLNDPQIFFRDLSKLNQTQLYTTAANNQVALKQVQDEFMELERLIGQLRGNKSNKNPQQFPTYETFEERKESGLYGYKYEVNKPALLQNGLVGNRSGDDVTDQEKRDVRLFQEPFDQGGFVPTKRQYEIMLAKAGDSKNVDNWKPIEKNGRLLIPRQQVHHDEYPPGVVRKTFEDTGELLLSGTAGSIDPVATPKAALNKIITRTRYDGRRHPPTSRDVSVAPSGTSTPAKRLNSPVTPEKGDETPSSKRRRVEAAVKPKVDVPNKPKHPNQYTKAREAREREAREREAQLQAQAQNQAQGGSDGPVPAPVQPPVQANAPTPQTSAAPSQDWTSFTTDQLRRRKWTDLELVDAVKQNHLWLHDDANKAEDWKQKIINGTNPVRSFSMFKKWAYWKDENKDKRPRGKKEGSEFGDLKKNGRLLRTISKKTMESNDTPSEGCMTPMSDIGVEYDGQHSHNSLGPTPVNGRSRLGTEIPPDTFTPSYDHLRPGHRLDINGVHSDTTTPATGSQFTNTPIFTSMLMKHEEPRGYFDVVYDHSSSQPANSSSAVDASSQNDTAATTPSEGKRVLRSARRGSA